MPVVSPKQVEQYQREGYFILESVIPEPALAALRDECMRLVDDYDRDMEARGIETQGITHYKKRYFISNRSAGSPIMTEFLFSELMAEICRATLGETAYLFQRAVCGQSGGYRQQIRLAPGFRLRRALSPRLSVLLVRAGRYVRRERHGLHPALLARRASTRATTSSTTR